MLLKRVLISIAIFSAVESVSYAQQAPTADSTAPKELSEEERKKAEALEEEAREKAKQQREKEEASKTKAPKKVFKPTEEISEDSPVPFPVDI